MRADHRLKKIILFAICGLLIVGLMGCESVSESIRKKFIPKKKKEDAAPVMFYEDEFYSHYPNAVLYDNHYTYWKTWEKELIESLSGINDKKIAQCAKLALGEMGLMRKYLTEPKAVELDKWMKDLQTVNAKIDQGGLSGPSKMGMRSTLQTHFTHVNRVFQTKNVKDFIIPDVAPPKAETSQEAE